MEEKAQELERRIFELEHELKEKTSRIMDLESKLKNTCSIEQY